jgi:preprotein translocase subunit SecE
VAKDTPADDPQSAGTPDEPLSGPASESAQTPSQAATPGYFAPGDDSSDDSAEPVTVGSPEEVEPPGDQLGAELRDPEPFAVLPDDDAEKAELSAADSDETAEELTSEPTIDDADELAAAEAEAIGARSTRPVRKSNQAGDSAAVSASATVEAARKNRPTRSRKEATAHQDSDRTTPVMFVNQSIQELKKVVWPTGAQLRQYFIVVLIFVLFMIALVSLLDLGIGQLILKIFGGGTNS